MRCHSPLIPPDPRASSDGRTQGVSSTDVGRYAKAYFMSQAGVTFVKQERVMQKNVRGVFHGVRIACTIEDVL